ncbi:methyl-accepting chemotaxis protein [Paenibacillus sp. GYB004]|uniref:methyl-accepting chemotaxis protein n=1 Tax=Paenibacillus sp. GYB004 TaxID=2994393 RepID=UPI002F969299
MLSNEQPDNNRKGIVTIGKRITGKLQNKLIIFFLLVALVPLIGTAIFVYQKGSSELITKQRESYEKLVDSRANGINQWLEERMGNIKLLATTSEVKSTDNAAKSRFLQSITKNTEFDGNGFLNPKGTVEAVDTLEPGTDLSMRPFFHAGMEGRSTFSDVLLAKTTGKRSIIAATPVIGNNGEKLGVLTGVINFGDFVTAYLQDLNLDGGKIYPIVIDNLGAIQVHPQEDVISQPFEEASLPESLKDIFRKEKTSSNTYTYRDGSQEYLVVAAPIPSTNYGLYLHVPVNSITAAVSSIQTSVIVIILLVSAIVIGFAYMIARQITRPIKAVADIMTRVSNGDLRVERLTIRSRDEVGQLAFSLNGMVDQLKHFVAQVNRTATEVAASSEELSTNAEETNKATEQIAVSIQEVADGNEMQVQKVDQSVKSIEKVAMGVHQIASSAESVAKSSMSASEAAEAGNKAIQSVIVQMNSIEKTVSDIEVIVRRLGDGSQEIGEMVKFISDIAAQTNLLALNAAIEAARAGEQGRGFAVVAAEVRKLAEQSAQSAGQIAQMVANIQSETLQTVQSMEQGTREVAIGLEVVGQAGRSFEEIQQTVEQVAGQIQEVASSSQKMLAETEEVVTVINNISEIAAQSAVGTTSVSAATEEQLATMEEVTSSATSLASMAEDLNRQVGKFRI